VACVHTIVDEAFLDDLIKQGFEQRGMRALRELFQKVANTIIIDIAKCREPTVVELGKQCHADRDFVRSLRMLLPRMDAAGGLHDHVLETHNEVVRLREVHDLNYIAH